MGLSFSRHATQCAEYIAEPRAERSAKKSSSRSDNSCLGGFSIFKSSNGKKAKIESHIVLFLVFSLPLGIGSKTNTQRERIAGES